MDSLAGARSHGRRCNGVPASKSWSRGQRSFAVAGNEARARHDAPSAGEDAAPSRKEGLLAAWAGQLLGGVWGWMQPHHCLSDRTATYILQEASNRFSLPLSSVYVSPNNSYA